MNTTTNPTQSTEAQSVVRCDDWRHNHTSLVEARRCYRLVNELTAAQAELADAEAKAAGLPGAYRDVFVRSARQWRKVCRNLGRIIEAHAHAA
jgi:hypothetical protein